MLLPQPTRQETLEPGQTEDGSSVDTRKWRYEAEDTTFAVTCERLDRGTWGLAWAQHAALGIFTQFQASNSKTTGVQKSPVQVGKLVGIAIESTSPDDRGRLLARFVTHDAVALQLIATFPDDPRWRSAAKTFVQSLRADDHLSKVSSNAKDEATLAAFASTLGAKQR